MWIWPPLSLSQIVGYAVVGGLVLGWVLWKGRGDQ